MALMGCLTSSDYPLQDDAILQNPKNVMTIMNFSSINVIDNNFVLQETGFE